MRRSLPGSSKEYRVSQPIPPLGFAALQDRLNGASPAADTQPRRWRRGTAAAGAQPPASEARQEVTVTAHRVEREKRVYTSVNRIAAAANEEGLPRWKAPVCPLVAGLTKQEGVFIVARVSENARKAGAPLAGENCHPKNLYMLVHPQPKELLQAMEKRNHAFTFGVDDTSPEAFDSVLKTPRAVRVWYTTEERNLDGAVFVRRPGDPPPLLRTTGSTLDRCGSSHMRLW